MLKIDVVCQCGMEMEKLKPITGPGIINRTYWCVGCNRKITLIYNTEVTL